MRKRWWCFIASNTNSQNMCFDDVSIAVNILFMNMLLNVETLNRKEANPRELGLNNLVLTSSDDLGRF